MIKEISLNEIPGRRYKDCKLQKDIMQFVNSDWSACEVDTSGYTGANSARNAYRKCAMRLNVNVDVLSRSGMVFLVKGDTK